MPVESVFPRLEPLLPSVSKPIQYVGGELNSTVKDWDSCDVRWALMYPDAYEVGVPNQGVMILYEVLNERRRVLAERTYAVWPDLEALMREHGVPAVHGRRAPAGRRVRRARACRFATELGYTNMLHDARPRRHPAARRATAPTTHPIVVAGGHAAFNPEPVADFIDAAVLGDGEEAVLEITEVVRGWKAEGRPGGRDELLLRLARTGGVYVPALLRRRLPARRPDPAGRPQPPRRAVAGRQAHRDGPRRVAVPEAAARAAGRVGARADVGRDLPRLHPRLPVLPGRA